MRKNKRRYGRRANRQALRRMRDSLHRLVAAALARRGGARPAKKGVPRHPRESAKSPTKRSQT
jgi:hypothetical protein